MREGLRRSERGGVREVRGGRGRGEREGGREKNLTIQSDQW